MNLMTCKGRLAPMALVLVAAFPSGTNAEDAPRTDYLNLANGAIPVAVEGAPRPFSATWKWPVPTRAPAGRSAALSASATSAGGRPAPRTRRPPARIPRAREPGCPATLPESASDQADLRACTTGFSSTASSRSERSVVAQSMQPSVTDTP